MNLILFIAGLLIMLITAYDLVHTTFAPLGSSLISGAINKAVWWLLKLLPSSSGILKGAGIVIIVSYLLTWVLLLWLGNALMFISAPEAVLHSTSQLPATSLERVYYAGYVLSTMGNGDFEAGTDGWLVYSAFVSFTGLMLITIAITYMVPVLSAVTDRQSLSIRIASIGHGPQEMLLNNWNGKDFSMLNEQLQELAMSIARQGQQHLAYPVLHYFYHSQKKIALIPNLVALDEALSILLLYVPQEQQPGRQYLEPVRKAVTAFLESLESSAVCAGTAPPLSVDILRAAGIPLKEPLEASARQLDHRRCILKRMLNNGGWQWKDLDAPVFNAELDLTSLD